MLLDYNYSNQTKNFTISYIKEDGNKSFINFNNINRFKSYCYAPDGKYKTWDDATANECYVEKPSKFDERTFLFELNDTHKKLIDGKTLPKMYTFDIETEINEDGEFPEPSLAKQAITNISVVAPNLDTIVFGWKELSNTDIQYINKSFNNYIDNIDFYKTLNIPSPSFKYVKCDNEKEMLEIFLKKIVAKVPVLAGWNSIRFDWQYIVNRITNFYPNLSLKCCSYTKELRSKMFTDKMGNSMKLPMPMHTLIIDMMDVIESEDKVVMPIKESMALDYIAKETIKAGKIAYKGSLQKLFEENYKEYVFYNSIDSVLVQLINYFFRTMDHIYMYARYCTNRIGDCFSKISLTEALVFKDFYEKDIKIVYNDNDDIVREKLIGAYVKTPIPGKYEYICCNDFASLYPSTIITCNLSFENYIGHFYDEAKLEQYRKSNKYVVIGGGVYENESKNDKPKAGKFVCQFLDEEKLSKYRNDKNYFVSVNGVVYKNDKEYSFKRIQRILKSNRNVSKYLSKKLEADVMSDFEHLIAGKDVPSKEYSEDIVKALEEIGYSIKNSDDLKNIADKDAFKIALRNEIMFHTCNEQAMKLLGNSMYGGSSHVSFYWYNMDLANDITGEARNIIHLMEKHIPEHIQKNWAGMKELHKKMGIEVDEEKCKTVQNMALGVYGDTDSVYLSYENLLKTVKGYETLTPSQKFDIILKLNTEHLDEHNTQFMKEYYETRFCDSVQKFELETIAKSGVWLDKKKKYAQILLWKDGKLYDEDALPMKIKGLEIIKSSTPKIARVQLKKLIRTLLEEDKGYLLQRLNMQMQESKKIYYESDIDDICESTNVNKYKFYIKDDSGACLEVEKKCPSNARGLGMYNWLINKHNLKCEHVYGGKLKIYEIKTSSKNDTTQYLAYPAMEYPDWAYKLAPVDKKSMFEKNILDPFNRVLSAIGMHKLEVDGNIQLEMAF